MSDEMCKKDIRALLKTFGVSADEAIVGHMAKNPGVKTLNLKVTLEDLTNYGDDSIEKLNLETVIKVDGVIIERSEDTINKDIGTNLRKLIG